MTFGIKGKVKVLNTEKKSIFHFKIYWGLKKDAEKVPFGRWGPCKGTIWWISSI